jgi:hypothetical protein
MVLKLDDVAPGSKSHFEVDRLTAARKSLDLELAAV